MPGTATLVEICVETLDDARAAVAAGAQRLESCAELSVGGVTPGEGTLRAVCRAVDVPVVALVRPRGGDFVHAASEQDAIAAGIEMARAAGAAGVAVGALREDGRLDLESIAAWAERARPMAVVVHRVFERAVDPLDSLDDLVAIGVDRVLVSPAIDCGLAACVARAAGRVVIVAAGGVRSSGVAELVGRSGVTEVHSSARTGPALGGDDLAPQGETFDPGEVRAIVEALR